MNTEINFEGEYYWNMDSQSIHFKVDTGEDVILCTITKEALMSLFGYHSKEDSKEKAIKNFTENRKTIDLLAKEMIKDKEFTNEGVIKITNENKRVQPNG